MIYYAGIGSREITEDESELIIKIGKKLSTRCILYSGNADGADISFQKGSEGRCVIMLPWKNFNKQNYSLDNCLDSFVVGETEEGNKAVDRFHPAPQSLKAGGRMCICRNYHQVMGYDNYPKVTFVICCADQDKTGNVLGGTGQAVRVARANNIPVFNMRADRWRMSFREFLEGLLR